MENLVVQKKAVAKEDERGGPKISVSRFYPWRNSGLQKSFKQHFNALRVVLLFFWSID